MDGFQSVLVDMGVNLCGGYVGMAEHYLNCTQIGTARQQVGGKGVAQHVGRDGFIDSRHGSGFSYYLPESGSAHRFRP